MRSVSGWCCGMAAATVMLCTAVCYAESAGAAAAQASKPDAGSESKANAKSDTKADVKANADGDSTISLAGLLCPTRDAVALRLYNNAIDLAKQGKLSEAEAQYRMAIARDPGYCDAMDNLGLLMRRQGKLEEAVTWYQHSLKLKPDNGIAHQDLAVAYKMQGNLGAALTEYLWLTEHQPANPEGFYGVGMLLLAAGKDDDAIVKLQVAEKLYAETHSSLVLDAWYLLGVAFYNKKEIKKAKAYLLQVYPKATEEPNVNFLLGMCYLDPVDGDKAKAVEHLKKAKRLGVKIEPEVERLLQ